MNYRGQGTTEYLIILAIVIVIALVVVSVLGGFPNFASGITAGQSKAYWSSTQPLSLIEWSVGTSTGTLVFQNQTSSSITLNDVIWNGASVSLASDVVIAPGAVSNVTDTDFQCGTGVSSGSTFSVTMGYTYSTPNLSNLDFNGIQRVVGNCQ